MNTMQPTYPRLPDTPVSHLPFSPVCIVPPGQSLVFISGQASVDATGKIILGTFEEEFRRSIENVKAVLATAGCALKDVIQTRNYVRDPEDLPLYNQLYREYFSEPFPTRTTIVQCLSKDSIRYEIEAVAVQPSKQ
jgi:2-iminobutanoate/2-iminopropanoate deaminase